MSHYALRLLGPFALLTPDGTRIDISSKKACALLALLAMASNGERSRTWLRTMLWETRDEEQAMASLRRELSSLGRQLDACGAGTLLLRSRDRIQLDLGRINVDALDLALHIDSASSIRDNQFLEGFDLRDSEAFEDWLRNQRSRIDDLVETIAQSSGIDHASPDSLLGEALPPKEALLVHMPPPVPIKPSLAVMPFLYDGERNNSISIGYAEEIGFAIARYPALFVVASAAASALYEAGMGPRDIAHQLGVRYLVDGRIELTEEKIVVAVSLLEGKTAASIWSHRFVSDRVGQTALQEEIAEQTASQIRSKIDLTERHRGRTGQLRSADSYDLYWQAQAQFREWTAEGNRAAIALCKRIEEVEPGNVLVAALVGFCHAIAYQAGWSVDPLASRQAAISCYQFTLASDPNNVEVLGYAAGTMVSIGGDMRVAERLIDRALSILPGYQPTLFWGGWVDIANGKAARARSRFEMSLRVNPASAVRAYAIGGIGIAFLLEGQFDDAYTMLSDAVTYGGHYPASLAGYCIAAAMVGQTEEARAALQALEQRTPIANVLSIVQDEALRNRLLSVMDAVRAA
ncbi:MAG: tetratricopeptide repeat protein [Sphingopyxis sp.]